ncbi:MAG: hypothetical protein ACPGPS_04040 [Rubripirellula sp.]
MSDNTEFVAQARQKCAMSIRNTAVGDWLGDALRRLEEADAENERLREALGKIANGEMLDIITATDIAVRALEGGDQ